MNIYENNSKSNGYSNRVSFAMYLTGLGFSVIPIDTDGTKQPAPGFRWKQYQRRIAGEVEITGWWGDIEQDMAIVCGAVSKNLLVIDFDEKNERGLFEKWKSSISATLVDKLRIYRTPSGGYHAYCRLPKAAASEKLAKSEDGTTLIETKGCGGYVLAPGHQSYGEYKFLCGPELEDLPVLTTEEWQQLRMPAIAMNRCKNPVREQKEEYWTDEDHADAIARVSVPVELRLDMARRWLTTTEGAIQGKGADGYCFALAVRLVWGFAVPEEEAIKLLYEWGTRPDNVDRYGLPYPWTMSEIEHKIRGAVGAIYDGRTGDQLDKGWGAYEKETGEKATAVVTPATEATPPKPEPKPEPQPTPPKPEPKPEPQPTPQPKTDRSWKSYSVEEIANWRDPVCQIENHWEVGANVMLFGASGSGKSFFALDAAFCIATGRPLFGKYAVIQGPVIYLCGEGQAGIRKRIEAWRTYHNVPVEELKDFRMITQPFDLRDPDKTKELILGIYEDLGGRNPVAVFIDTLSCYMYGSDRNDEDAKNYIFSCNMLTKNLGATVISVHHTGWDAGDRNRGASNFKDSADTQIKVETAGVQRSNISFIKQKNMELGIPYFIVKKLVAESVVWCLEKEVITKRMNLTDKQRAFLDFIIERCGMQKFDDIELRHAAEQEHLGTAKSLREWIKEFAKLQFLICEGEQLYRINTAICPEAVR